MLFLLVLLLLLGMLLLSGTLLIFGLLLLLLLRLMKVDCFRHLHRIAIVADNVKARSRCRGGIA